MELYSTLKHKGKSKKELIPKKDMHTSTKYK